MSFYRPGNVGSVNFGDENRIRDLFLTKGASYPAFVLVIRCITDSLRKKMIAGLAERWNNSQGESSQSARGPDGERCRVVHMST